MSALAHERWVLTGAAGQIATRLRPGLAAAVGTLQLVDHVEVAGAESTLADLRDLPALEAALAGADGVLHLGGLADEADFHDLAEVNIVGAFHLFEAARRAGVRRVVYASSNRLTGAYAVSERVDVTMPPRPDGLYGVTKVAGEALGRLYADKFGLEVVCLRIGSFEERPADERQLSTWLSPGDGLRAFLAAMSAPGVDFAAFYAVSDNRRGWWDLEAGRALGFQPADDAELFAADLAGSTSPEPDAPQGGAYASPAYTLDRQRGNG